MEVKQRKNVRQRAGNSQRPRSTPARTQRTPQNKKTKDVVYTQPETFNRNRFLLRLATVVAVVLALLFGMTIFFKVDVEKSTVSGAVKYTAWDVWEASGIQDGENLLTLNKAKAYSKIKEALPYVDTVRIGIKLPDMVNIEIKELAVVYSVEADDGSWWHISYDGTVVDKTTAAEAGESTKIKGVKLAKTVAGEVAVAAEPKPQQGEEGETVPVTVLGSERLETVISIISNLEKTGVIGEIVSIDVSDFAQITLWYGQRYQVLLGDNTQLEKKISSMKQAIDQRGEYQTGKLDVSFSIWPEVHCEELS